MKVTHAELFNRAADSYDFGAIWAIEDACSRDLDEAMAEYDAAKEEQAKIEGRIEEIENLLKHVEVVDEDDMKKGHVSVGSTVKILDVEMDEELTYQIVGATEASIEEGKMSNESPVGKALIGAKKGDTVSVETPAGLLEFKVLSIKNS